MTKTRAKRERESAGLRRHDDSLLLQEGGAKYLFGPEGHDGAVEHVTAFSAVSC